jgi:aspartate/methionine/tyrosine aminotransferase
MSDKKPLARRLQNLGTETAYAISEQAAALQSQGKKIYPFHIGDLNLEPPEAVVKGIQDAVKLRSKTGYCPAAGITPLREAIAFRVGKNRGVKYTKENVLVQPGGKPVIGKFLLSCMEEGDEVLLPTPGYPIYNSLVNFYGGVAKSYLYRESKTGFKLDIEEIKSLITKKTKIFIYNNHHNPTGAVSDKDEMQAIADLCIKNNLFVLSDEAYCDLVYGQNYGESIVALPGMQERTVILLTASKSWAMTGFRLGAAIGPEYLINPMVKLVTNDEAMVTQFVQWGTIPAFLGECDEYIARNREQLQKRRDVLIPKVNEIYGFSCVAPKSTFYVLVNVTKAMKAMSIDSIDAFQKTVLNATGVSFCTRLHFGEKLPQETEHYIRLAYSGIEIPQILEAISAMKAFIESSISKNHSKL